MKLDECINFMLTRVQNTVFNYFKDKLAKFDVTPVQYAILKCLWDHGDQSPSQLSHALYLDSSTITGILARMERKDLIERVHSDKDRRAVNIHILPAGKKLQKGIEQAISEANAEVLNGIDPGDFADVKDSLMQIVDNVESLNAPAVVGK